jgi:hypothetical protein
MQSDAGSRLSKARVPKIFYACVLLALTALVVCSWQVPLIISFAYGMSGRAHEHRPLPASAADAILRGESTRNDGARIQASWKVHGMCRWIASIHRPLALLWTYSACNRLGHQLEAQALERRHLHTGMACRLLPPRRTRQAIVEFVRGSNIEVPISLDRSSRHMLTPSEPVN